MILSALLLVLSCNKMDGVKTVDLAKLSADYEAKDGDILTGILDGNYKIAIASAVFGCYCGYHLHYSRDKRLTKAKVRHMEGLTSSTEDYGK